MESVRLSVTFVKCSKTAIAGRWGVMHIGRGFKCENGFFSHHRASDFIKLRSLAKCSLTLEITMVYSFVFMMLSAKLSTLLGRRMISSVPVVELWIEHKLGRISRPHGF